MSRKCSCCEHPKIIEINAALLNGDSIRDVSGRYGLAKSSVQRHKKDHLGGVDAAIAQDPRIVEATEKVINGTSDRVSDFEVRFRELRDKIDTLLATADEEKNRALQLGAIREARGLLDLESKVVLQILGMKGDDEPIIIKWLEE